MKIAVVGTGYVGLVTGTCFAEKGNDVVCVDINKEKVSKMQKGIIPIYEPGLEQIFKRNIQEGRIKFTTSLHDGVRDALVVFLALPTPPRVDGSADLSSVLDVAESIGETITSYKVIVNKSTVPVGTSPKVEERIRKRSQSDFDVVSNPEFLREGFAVQDFMNPDRIVVGSSSIKAKGILRDLYEPFVRQGDSIIEMDEASAEVTKYAANTFLATKISFMNELANLCEKVGANVDCVRLGIGSDERIGKRFLFPGIGYGGSCFPKDVKAFIGTAQEHDYSLSIIEAAQEVNERQKLVLIRKIERYYKGDIEGKLFALWGLSFKPDTDDIREAPSLEIINILTRKNARVAAFDPQAMSNVKSKLDTNLKIKFVENEYLAVKGADALIIATDWSEFQNPDFRKIKSSLKNPVIFDGRNLYNLNKMKELGFHYESIGRKIIN